MAIKSSKREQILETAGKLFIQNGFQAVSVDQIAAAVPVSKPTLYVHFKDKRDLFTAVISQRCERALASMKAGIAEGHTAEESLQAFGRHFLDLLLSKEALQFHRVIIGESAAFPDMAKMFFETGPKQTHALLESYMDKLHEDGVLNIPDPARGADLFISMVKGYTHMKCLLGIKKEVSRDEREQLVKTAVDLFVRGHGKTGK